MPSPIDDDMSRPQDEPDPATDEPAAEPTPAPAAAADGSTADAAPVAAPDAAPVAAPDAAPAPTPLDPAAVAALLAQHFPALFRGPPKPIKLHVHADIQARVPGVFTRRALSAFLHRHTGSSAYLLALSRATQRYDLDGAPAGELSAEHREAAIAELARRRALVQQRRAEDDEQRALLDQQRRNRATLLRDFEGSTLTRANFCVLKQVAEDELDGLLEVARRERNEAPPIRAASSASSPAHRSRRGETPARK